MAADEVMPIVVASENGRAGATAAMELLRQGGSALDAVEIACRVTEADPDDHSVGYGGMPNALGQVELDASIMDGRTLRSGAVAALLGYGHPISLARLVMDQSPHVLLVGRGAERFAEEMGLSPADQRTEAALQRWYARFGERGLRPGSSDNLVQTAFALTAPVTLEDRDALKPSASSGDAPKPSASSGDAPKPVTTNKPAASCKRDDTLGTVNYLARDRQGNLASAVSTSGIAWKYPSRVGDSPIIGAGNYCDNRYGAAACTGMGELAIRAATARSVILYLKFGMTLEEAGREALADLAGLETETDRRMNFVVLSPAGRHAGFTTVPNKQYLYFTGEMDAPALAPRTLAPTGYNP